MTSANSIGNLESVNRSTSVTAATHSFSSSNEFQVLLSTALIWVYDKCNSGHLCRALLDSGSQSNFITERLGKRLQLKMEPINIAVAGIGQLKTQLKHKVQLKLGSRHNAFQINVECIVMDKITDPLPNHSVNRSSMRIPKNLKLADPNFHVMSDIDLLIGAEIFWQLLCVGQIKQSNAYPLLQKTHFGWIAAGSIPLSPSLTTRCVRARSCHIAIANKELHDKLSEFWRLEDYGSRQPLTRGAVMRRKFFA